MRILVTGSEGGIGRHLVPILRQRGDGVRTLDVVDVTPTGEHEYLHADLLDLQALRRAAQGMDAVVHLGAMASDMEGRDDHVLRVNVEGTWNVLLACAEACVGRMVFFSSINALGNVGGHRPSMYLPIDDQYPRHPISAYQLSKHLGEEICRSFSDRYGMVTLCLRPTWVALPHHYREWQAIDPDELVERLRDEYWAYVDVRDVCDAVVRALSLDSVRHDVFLLSANDTVAHRPTEELAKQYYPSTPWHQDRATYVAHRPYRSLVDCSHAAAVLGWHPRHRWRDFEATEAHKA